MQQVKYKHISKNVSIHFDNSGRNIIMCLILCAYMSLMYFWIPILFMCVTEKTDLKFFALIFLMIG